MSGKSGSAVKEMDGNVVAYRALAEADAPAVSRLIIDSFTEFIAPEYSEEGRAEFIRYVQPEALVDRSRSNHLLLVARAANTVVGVIELRNNDHVSLLFVDRAFQQHGIARTLLRRALSAARPAIPDLERVTVNSSRFGVPIYERLGFCQTGPGRSVNGIVFIPMAHQLAPDPTSA